jgi:hypothetical protein
MCHIIVHYFRGHYCASEKRGATAGGHHGNANTPGPVTFPLVLIEHGCVS